jgi:D-beta-D-heptose 7-phosphate kinase/D-beta-D-heptose 1-phosphate adenosyltransferase
MPTSRPADIVVISDYAKGFVSPAVARTVIERAHAAGKQVIVDPRPQHRDSYIGCDYITPNWKEARGLLNLPDADPLPETVSAVASALAAKLSTNVVLTLGPHGILFCSRDSSEEFSQPTMAREVFDVSGAGDTVVAAFALSCASGASHSTAGGDCEQGRQRRGREVWHGHRDARGDPVRHAGVAARQTRRTRSTGREASIEGPANRHTERCVRHPAQRSPLHAQRGQAAGRCSDRRPQQRRVRPRVQGRWPADRAGTEPRGHAARLRAVDFVHIFDESDPIAFLEQVRPDVHVNGAEYGENCIEGETVRRAGGIIHLVPRIQGLSTSD